MKSAIKNTTEVTIRLLSNMIRDSNDEKDFTYTLLLNDIQVSRLCKAFMNKSSGNITLLKTQLIQIVQSTGFIGRFLGLLMKVGLPLMKNLLKPLAKILLAPLVLTASVAVERIDALWTSYYSFPIILESVRSRTIKLIVFRQRNVVYHENSSISRRLWLINLRDWSNN